MKRKITVGLFWVSALLIILPLVFPGHVGKCAAAVAGRMYPDIQFAGPASGRIVYLTIDDVPSPEGTGCILETLRRHNVKATFFIVSDYIDRREQIEAILADGHHIGHHMKTAHPVRDMSFGEFTNEFDAAEAAFEPYGLQKIFRPASGLIGKRKRDYAVSKGYTIVMGTIYPSDHRLKSVPVLERLIRRMTYPGGIIILHDQWGRGVRTAEVLDLLIPNLKKKGYTFDVLKGASGEV